MISPDFAFDDELGEAERLFDNQEKGDVCIGNISRFLFLADFGIGWYMSTRSVMTRSFLYCNRPAQGIWVAHSLGSSNYLFPGVP